MKILLVNKFFYKKGGAETVYFQEREMLRQEGFDIVEFSMTHESNEASDYSDYFVSNVDYYQGSGIIAKLKTAQRFIHNSEACEKFSQLLEKERPDIVHFHNIYHQITPSIIKIAKQFGCITVLTAHDYKIACPNYTMYRDGQVCEACVSGSVWNAFKYRCQEGSASKSLLLSLEALYQSWSKNYHALDVVVSPSAFLSEKIQQKLPTVRTEVIVNGIDENIAQGEIEDEGYFVYVGRLSSEKGVPTLLSAHQQLAVDFPLKVVGTGPMYEQLTAEYDSAEFYGYQSGRELENLIKKARAVIVPSEWYENCSMSVLEAMAYGKPVIGAKIGGIPEQIRDQQEGLLFEAGNQQALTDALHYMATNPEQAQKMGRQARQRLIEKYSLSKHKADLLGLYQELTETQS
ncbi:glycosyltransferase family 4 protein [Vibrio litoralis]|uniref:glycosyltransferase family 4 protein n=1 Tax=Vibrio litoralis TaxID=335972 RepID=UPI00042824E6|nr:glycosyltransferase family 4 protein [Vibrio litoralis]